MSIRTATQSCFHCGDRCDEELVYDAHTFCCAGCKNVYQLLSGNNLCDYYNLEAAPGISRKSPVLPNRFDYLDDEQVQHKLIEFKDAQLTRVTFFIPTMHCSSCIWLLEHIYRIEPAIVSGRVNFMKKQVTFMFHHDKISLRKVVTLIASLGYEPAINLNSIESEVKQESNRKLSYQIGVAGFSFGNIMLISFPEYFGLDTATRNIFSDLFGYLNFGLALPVFFFSAQDYFKNAWAGMRKGFIGIDVPLALGILVLFLRSSAEVFTGSGAGYFDTLAGLVFFLLIGKWFQQKTFDTLSFDRDYKSYFPVAVSVLKGNDETTVPVTALAVGDRILIRNQELIPADAILMQGDAHIDFSFVTGESNPVDKSLGEMVYAGGRQIGAAIELVVTKKVSQSYLTQLWNNEHFAKEQKHTLQSFQQVVSKYFTIALIAIAFGAAAYWLVMDAALAMPAFTAVLIIACPCALALSSPFALGTAMRILGNNRCYVKAPDVIEQLAHAEDLVFDKTGTLTQTGEAEITWHGMVLNSEVKTSIASLARHSVHPLSRRLVSYLQAPSVLPAEKYIEVSGLGQSAEIANHAIALGSRSYMEALTGKVLHTDLSESDTATRVYMALDDTCLGYFEFAHAYREGVEEVMHVLKRKHAIYLLSGDQDRERTKLQPLFGMEAKLLFKQSPLDKLNFVDGLRKLGKQVVMVGDGLNDAGALKAASIGISVTEDTAHFSPASDIILDASRFNLLPRILNFCKDTRRVIHLSFVISLIYNLIGLSFAVQGTLSPLIAAVLMPLSSVTVIGFTTLATTLYAKRGGLQ